MTRRMSAILGEYSPAGQGCTRHFSVPPLEYKNSTSYKKYRPNFGLNIQESYGKRPMLLLSRAESLHHGVDAVISTPSISVDVQGSIGHGCYSLHVGGHRSPPCCAKNFCRKR